MTVIDFQKAKEKREKKNSKPEKNDFSDRMSRIRQSLAKINVLLEELRSSQNEYKKNEKEKDEI